MTGPLLHPVFCDPEHCRAYAAGAEPYHRSAPVTIPVARGEVVAVFLAQPAGMPEMTAVDLVALQPTGEPAWAAEDAHAEMVLPLDAAAALAQAIRQLIRAATA